MEYLSVVLIIIVLVLLVILLTKKNNDSEMIERLGRFEVTILKDINDFKDSLTKNLNGDFNILNEKIETKFFHRPLRSAVCYLLRRQLKIGRKF